MSILSFQHVDFFDSFDGDYRNKLFRSTVKKFELTVKNPCLSIKFPFNLPETYIIRRQKIIVPSKHYRIINPKDEVIFFSDHEEPAEAISIFLGDDLIKEVFYEMQQKEPRLEPMNHDKLRLPNFYEKNTSVQSDGLGELLLLLQNANGKEIKSKSLFYDITEQMIYAQQPHLYCIARISALKGTTRKEIYHRLNLAREFIHDSIETNFKVRDVARTIFVSEYSFIRQFKEVYHCTPYQYILQLKIERAKVLLKNENVSISDVAFRLGFSDLSSFGKCFHRWTGITPTQYRL